MGFHILKQTFLETHSNNNKCANAQKNHVFCLTGLGLERNEIYTRSFSKNTSLLCGDIMTADIFQSHFSLLQGRILRSVMVGAEL